MCDAQTDTLMLNEVEIFEPNRFGVRSAQMSAVEVSGELIRTTPTIFGEYDVLKTLQQMPGVTPADDGRAVIYVRGGDYDQNLIMIDGIPYYKPEHMAGFMSAMDPDMVAGVDLYTGAFPSRFGGRLSSIVDLSLIDGDTQIYGASASVGMLSSRINVHGPIAKGRSSFNFGARASYYGAIVKPVYKLLDKSGDGLRPYSRINFYDFTLKTRFELSKKAMLSVTSYFSHDVYDSAPKFSNGEGATYSTTAVNGKTEETVIRTERAIDMGTESSWNNFLASAKLDYDLGHGYSMGVTAATSMLWYMLGMHNREMSLSYEVPSTMSKEEGRIEGNYFMRMESDVSERQRFHSDVIDVSISASFSRSVGAHALGWGLLAKSMHFNPTVDYSRWLNSEGKWMTPGGGYMTQTYVLAVDSAVGRGQALNSIDLYAEDDWSPTPWLKVNLGLRFATNMARGKAYANIEPRISAAYLFASGKAAIKASLSMMSQGVHYLYSSNLMVMSGIWIPSTKKYAPSTSIMGAGGICWELPYGFYLSAEGYYKAMDHLIEYREGASFFQSPDDWQDITTSGRGWAYGADLLVVKSMGKLSGQLKYSWSKSLRLFDRPGQELNDGRRFYAPNDRRNVAGMILVYRPNSRWTLSASWSYMTGRRATMPTHMFYGGMLDAFHLRLGKDDNFDPERFGTDEENYHRYVSTYLMSLVQYSTAYGRNLMVLPANHHLDLSADYSFRTGRVDHTLNLSIYNVYNRVNWQRAYLVAAHDSYMKLRGLCMFPFMPSVTYTISL